MGVDAVSGGAVTPTGAELRRLTDEAHPDAGDPGLTLEQVDRAGDRFGVGFALRTHPLAQLRADLDAGRWCVVQLWYAEVPAAYRHQSSAAFGHAIGCMAIDSAGTRTLTYDPLDRAAPRWVPFDAIAKAAERWGRMIGLPAGRAKWLASEALIPKV
jgi:hypothetical protein